MKTNLPLICIFTAALFSSLASAAKINMTPGLWEHSFAMSSQNGEMEAAMREAQKQLANMPADQRKLLEDLMAAQGVGISSNGSETQVRACITQSEIDSGTLPLQDENCTQTIVEQSKNTYKVNFSCGGDMPSNGTGEVIFSSSKAYTGTSTYTTLVQGKQEEMSMTQSGKWIAADCGKIKPHPLPQAE